MKTWVVYDSVFGNTGQIARAIGNALGSLDDVDTVRVSNLKQHSLKEWMNIYNNENHTILCD